MSHSRYFFLSEDEKKSMMQKIGIQTVNDLYPVSQDLLDVSLGIQKHLGEQELVEKLRHISAKNTHIPQSDCFIGAGCYQHYIPSAVDHLVQRSEFLTAYTPYQPEASQGTLSVLFEFQTMVTRLTGMDVANASMYDGATALVEAILMACRCTQRFRVHLANALHSQYREVLDTVLSLHQDITLADDLGDDTACVVVQVPDFFGEMLQLESLRKRCSQRGALLIVVVTECLVLGAVETVSVADIVVGEAQSLCAPPCFGGPHIGFFACKRPFLRQLPGRLCGQTVDQDGRVAYTLTLNTREQHIKRQKATSNICTNQTLLAIAFAIHVALLGEVGCKKLARLNHSRCCYFVDAVLEIPGVHVNNTHFFNEVTLKLPFDVYQFVEHMAGLGLIAGYPLSHDRLLVAVTEINTRSSIDRYVEQLRLYQAL